MTLTGFAEGLNRSYVLRKRGRMTGFGAIRLFIVGKWRITAGYETRRLTLAGFSCGRLR
jgi:hypothetical protein